MPNYEVYFYESEAGKELVRDWLQGLTKSQRKQIGEDIRVLQHRWPLGMPMVRKIAANLWELRSSITDGIARIFFTIDKSENAIVLLLGIIKKSQKTPKVDIETAKKRLKEYRRG